MQRTILIQTQKVATVYRDKWDDMLTLNGMSILEGETLVATLPKLYFGNRFRLVERTTTTTDKVIE